jgi:hypothetical protein
MRFFAYDYACKQNGLFRSRLDEKIKKWLLSLGWGDEAWVTIPGEDVKHPLLGGV